jgi:hypothetical protein
LRIGVKDVGPADRRVQTARHRPAVTPVRQ